ncbi:hypothetical protein HanPSC8_Chr01g0023671 [Helianthus annuus]|nr:hypothetical protein HanPSC8_Chr01g0023671 [Helianthus annuus]
MHPHNRNFDPNNPYGFGKLPNTASPPQGSQLESWINIIPSFCYFSFLSLNYVNSSF